MLYPFLTSKLVNSHILSNLNPNHPRLKNMHLKKKTSDVKLQTQSLHVSVSFSALNWRYVTRASMIALGLKPESNALVPQNQFRAVKPYFTGSAYIVSTQ
jgi:hypothetical protein